jgi:transposase-like protein
MRGYGANLLCPPLELTRFDGHPSIEMEVFAMGSNRSRRAYPPEFRQQVVELYHAGRSTTELARDFGPHPQSIRNWVACGKRDASEATKPSKPDALRARRAQSAAA